MHGCEDFSDLVHGPLAPGTGVLGYFDLIPYPPGFVLQLPAKGKPTEVAPFRDQPHLFQIFQEHKEWGRILGVNTVGRLNEVIANGEISEFINISEALHEKKVATIADRIGDRRGVRIVLVSGPSSAGKTTFSKRLAIQLRVNGRRTLGISLDDYFVASDRTPRDEAGQPDFEHIEAVDIAAFNSDLNRLINGEEVELPRFNFETRQREFSGKKLRVADDHVIIIEGIHGLNPRLTHRIAADRKFKIYISALTQLSIDSNNRISTTDNRLLRRMIRDHKFRGHPALTTLRMWPSVRRGEERWVFPFQGEADATFNSALDYELAVLKPMVEPLLMQVKPCDPEYAEARRLTAFLLNFLDVPDHGVPRTSILREYIGRSGFHY
jgi:uridine kinase